MAFPILVTTAARSCGRARRSNVIMLRYGMDGDEPRTLEEVGRALEVTRERVRQIESSALTKLRKRGRTRPLRELIG